MAELFVNPMMLWGAALASAPIIIHLLNKRRYRVHEWAAMDFLFAAMSSNRRRLKFEDLLLLLLRMLLILFLVFAVARPVIKGLAGWREDERVVVLDDSFSMEVVGPTGPVFESAKDAAIQQIRDAVGGSTPVRFWIGSDPLDVVGEISANVQGGTISDVTPGAPVDENLSSALAGKRLLDRIRETKTSDLPLEFAAIVRGVFEQAKEEAAPRVRTVVLVSDFRSSDWIGKDGALDDSLQVVFEEIEKQELQESVRFQFVDVGLPTTANIAVTDVRLEESPILAGVTARISVEVTNFGEEARVGINGDLTVRRSRSRILDGRISNGGLTGADDSVDGEEVTHSIPLPTISSIEAGESVRVEVQHVFELAGEFLLTASLESVRLGRDNESYLVVVVRDSLNAIVVDGAPNVDRFASESVNLLAALAPRGDVPSGVSTRRIDGTFAAADLADADAVFLLNRAELTDAERDVLEDFAESGGGIAWFVGNQVDPVRYRPLAVVPQAEADRVAIFPATLRELRELTGPTEAARWEIGDLEHPTFKLFRGLQSSPFEHLVFRRYFVLQPIDGARVLARYDDVESGEGDGTAAIIESLVERAVADEESTGESDNSARGGAGRVVLFNTSADRDWSDWPTDYTYPVLLQEWARYLAKPTGKERLRVMRGVLTISDDPGMRYHIVAPQGQESGVGPATTGRGVASRAGDTNADPNRDDSGSFEFEVPNIDSIDPDRAPSGARQFQPKRAGFYRLIASPRADAVVGTATDSAAKKAARSKDEWYAFRRRPAESNLDSLGEERLREALEPFDLQFTIGSEVEVDAFRREQEGEVWRYLAFAAGLFLLLELFVAWWFGRKA